jgi:hypothetical protein
MRRGKSRAVARPLLLSGAGRDEMGVPLFHVKHPGVVPIATGEGQEDGS